MRKKKILILGGSGFIGEHITKYFSKKKNIKVHSTYYKKKPKKLKNVKYYKIDLTDKTSLDKIFKNIDIVIQAAAVTTGSKDVLNKPYLHVTDNIIINTLILRSIYHSKVKHMIFFSCTVMYESSNGFHSENSQKIIKSNSPYFGVGNAKMYIEKQMQFYSEISNIKFTALRHSNIYGDGDKSDENKSHVLINLIRKSEKKSKFLEIWGDGKSIRDFLYIDDLISAVDVIINKQKTNFEIFNVGSENPISITELAKKILKIRKSNKKIKYIKNAPYISNSIKIKCSKIKKKLGWKSKINLKNGLKKVINKNAV